MNIAFSPSYHRPETDRQEGLQFAQLTHTGINSRAEADISLVTADGDKVTLSASSSLQAKHVTYDYLGRLHDRQVAAHAESLEIAQQSEFALSVEGELDQEELADIQKLIDAVQSTANDAFSDETDDLLSAFTGLDDLGSIASFDASVSYSKETVAERNASWLATLGQPALSSTPAAHQIRNSGADGRHSLLDRLIGVAERLHGDAPANGLSGRLLDLLQKIAGNQDLDPQDQKLAQLLLSEIQKRHAAREHETRPPPIPDLAAA